MSILQDAAADGRSEPTQSPPKIDLRSCPPDELAAWLLAHRFQDNAMDVASFLLNCTSALPNAEEISAQLLGGGSAADDDDDEDEEMVDGENEAGKSEVGGNEEAEDEPVDAAEQVAKPKADSPSELTWGIDTSRPLPDFAGKIEIEVSCTNPRGKFLLSVYENGVVLTNPKKRDAERIPISSSNVENVIWFRKPEDYKKIKQLSKNGGGGKGNKGVPGHMVLVCLEDACGVTFRNKPLKQACFQIPSYPPPSSSADDGDGKGQQTVEDQWWNGLSSALFSGKTNRGIVRVNAAMETPACSKSTSGFVFQSEGESGGATTTQAMPYVGCYQGFNDGALFPLREGLLFFKPPLFVPRSKLASISCGRGSGGSRYVDMVVRLESAPDAPDEEGQKKKKKASDALEFTNIHRNELPGLNDYIHKTLIPAMRMDADGTGDGSTDDDDDANEEAVAEVVDTSDDEDESDDDDDDDDDGGKGSGSRRRPSRAASKSAREITRAALRAAPVDRDDDSDEFEEEEEDSDSDESVVSDGESRSDSSDDDEELEEEMDDGSDGSDYEDRTQSKKARVE